MYVTERTYSFENYFRKWRYWFTLCNKKENLFHHWQSLQTISNFASITKSRISPLTAFKEIFQTMTLRFQNNRQQFLNSFTNHRIPFQPLLLTDTTFSSTQRLQTSSESSTSIQQTPPSTALPSTSSATSATSLKTLIGTPSEATRTPSSSPTRKAKLPRVTLKLRENETIPQMYMKAGIASYKKGNITTSVLAHGLSLEGLIFKTPEGTIKPWPQKWFFTAPSSDFQWKVQSPLQVS